MDLAGTAAGRDALAPRRPPGMRLGLALAIGAHVLLILAIAFGVAWKTSEPDGLVAATAHAGAAARSARPRIERAMTIRWISLVPS